MDGDCPGLLQDTTFVPDLGLNGKIHYYAREKYYQAMQDAALEGCKKLTGDPAYRFYSAISLLYQNQVQGAIRQLEPLKNDRSIILGVLLALITAHRKCQTIDKEAVSELDAKLKEERKKVDAISLFYGGLFLFLSERYEKAREYVDRALKLKQDYADALALKGWIEMNAGKERKAMNVMEFFKEALQQEPKHMDALFGKSNHLKSSNLYKESRDTLAGMVVAIPGFTPPLVENIKVFLAEQEWDQMLEAAHRVLSIDSHNLEALKYRALYTLCRQGNYDETSQYLQELYVELNRSEGNNAVLFIHMAQLFSRLCGRNRVILEETYMMASKAANIDPSSAEYMTEVGYQCLMKGHNKEALKFYKNATKLDETSIAALTGIISCQLLEGQIDIAEQQLEFLKEVQQMFGASPEILYLSAVLSKLKNEESDKILRLLSDAIEAIENQFRSQRTMVFGATYLASLNPDFLLLIVKECLNYAPNQPNSDLAPNTLPPVVSRCLQVLETITKACPAMIQALLLSAKAKFLFRDVKGAKSSLEHILENIDSTYPDAHLLMAQIQLNEGNVMQAQQSLDVSVSFNFEVREKPAYHLIKARVLKKRGEYTEAIKTLKSCLSLSSSRPTTSRINRKRSEVDLPDRVSIFMELSDAYMLNKQSQEASLIMDEALVEFKGTQDEMRLNLTYADLALARGDTEHAISILKEIGPSEKYYLQARDKMANIYLHYLKDKHLYAACYREIVEKHPTPQSYLLLGDAYMAIQEPERANEVYEQALKQNPRDSMLACRMGQALIKTHQYGKAINYYKDAIKTGSSNQLRYDMAELQMRLKQYEKAEKTIIFALKAEGSESSDLNSMIFQAKLFHLLSKVHERAENYEVARESLLEAKNIQFKVLKRAQVELPDTVYEQKELAASICRKMAEYYANERNFEQAILNYKEALNNDPESAPTLLALAKLYMQMKDLDQCQYTCMALLRMDKENDSATIMMADLSYRRNEYGTAMYHFQQLLDRRPTSFSALARLVEVMRRTGTLEEALPYLERAEQAVVHPAIDPGFSFCKALYEWYTGNPNGALKLFNKARKDQEWGQKAIYNMIEICLNPDNDTLGGETFEGVEGDLNSARDTQEMAIRTADKLIKELKPRPGEQQVSLQILNGFLLLATKQKSNGEAALSEFMKIANQENYKEHIGAILGMATAYMILKQTPKARNQLKRVAKNEWSFEDAEFLERCWLLLADIYVQTGKYDMATDLLKRCLYHNRSCMKAYEYMGFIMEKEQSYKDAAYHYEQAWKFSNNAHPMIGYKLAFNYMKAKRYVDAIDVCHSVLARHPEYPRIRKDILEKSRANIRI